MTCNEPMPPSRKVDAKGAHNRFANRHHREQVNKCHKGQVSQKVSQKAGCEEGTLTG